MMSGNKRETKVITACHIHQEINVFYYADILSLRVTRNQR